MYGRIHASHLAHGLGVAELTALYEVSISRYHNFMAFKAWSIWKAMTSFNCMLSMERSLQYHRKLFKNPVSDVKYEHESWLKTLVDDFR